MSIACCGQHAYSAVFPQETVANGQAFLVFGDVVEGIGCCSVDEF